MIILQKTALKQDEKLKSKTFEISPFYVKNSNSYIITLCIFSEFIIEMDFPKKFIKENPSNKMKNKLSVYM